MIVVIILPELALSHVDAMVLTFQFLSVCTLFLRVEFVLILIRVTL